MSKNCPNCGAPINPDSIHCDYCGTTYLDFPTIDFDKRSPIYIRLKQNGYDIVSRVIPVDGNITYDNEYQDITDGRGNTITRIRSNQNLRFDIGFDAIMAEDGTMYKVIMEDNNERPK